MVQVAFSGFAEPVARALAAGGLPAPEAQESGWAAAWLQAAGYKAAAMTLEALADGVFTHSGLKVSHGLVDTAGVSCVWLAPALARLAQDNGRIVLINARHGLFVLPFTVRGNFGIGCPVDPSFAIGGERTKNPYAEKVAQGEAEGVEVDDAQWTALLAHG